MSTTSTGNNFINTIRTAIVIGLGKTCELIDAVLYRPKVMRVTQRFPLFWNCQSAKLSWRLDDRWGIEWWGDTGRPDGTCEACHRRAAWQQAGGWAHESEEERGYPLAPEDIDNFMANRAVHLCGYCSLSGIQINTEEELQQALRVAGNESMGITRTDAFRD